MVPRHDTSVTTAASLPTPRERSPFLIVDAAAAAMVTATAFGMLLVYSTHTLMATMVPLLSSVMGDSAFVAGVTVSVAAPPP